MWSIEGSDLRLDGTSVDASLVLQSLAEDGGGSIRADLPGVRFSVQPLEVRTRIFGSFPDQLRLETVAVKAGEFWPIVTSTDHRVVGRTWHPLEVASLQESVRVSDGCEEGGISAGNYIRLLASPDAFGLIDETTHAKASDWGRSKKALQAPEGLKGDLFHYQVVGSTAMRILAGYDLGTLLADEMGLGKTLQAITLMLDQRDKGPSLVVAPASLLANWVRELKEFAPDLTVHVHAGPRRVGSVHGLAGYDVVITSYETVVNDLAFMEDVTWNIVALDEAQYIKNPDARRARAVKSLRRRISIAISGTPFENSLTDLWSLSEFVLPQLLGLRTVFQEQFPNDEEAAREAGRLVAPITVRRPVSEVAQDLPARMDSFTPIEPDHSDLEVLRHLRANSSAFGSMVEQSVICAHADDSSAPLDVFTSKPKVQYTTDLVAEAVESGDKVLIFASYQATLDRLLLALDQQLPGMFLTVIDGRMPSDSRIDVIDDFSSAEAGCLLLNPDAAGVGLNITAANHVIHFNPEWNPAVTAQATARAYRRRQDKPVFVHHLYYDGTIEQDAVERADFKKALAAAVDVGITEGGEGE